MPRVKTDYSKTVIYKIVCNDLEFKDIYVGHTTEFTKRKSSHKCVCNNKNNESYNLQVYKTIRANGGWENWTMIEIEKYPCKDANEARARERYWYEELNAKINKCIPIISDKERQEYKKKYEVEHAEEIKEYEKKYREKNNLTIDCECGGKYKHYHKITHSKTINHKKHLEEKILSLE
jgi:hypothetical protein